MITIIDYGAGNLKSIQNILNKLNEEYIVSSRAEDILDAKKIIFPGQGHFAQAMKSLTEKKLDIAILKAIEKGTPFLGICLGLQVLFEESEEAPNIKGLGIFKGKCLKFKQGKIPQIGWNKLKLTNNNSFLTEDYYYFVNSYYVLPENKKIISARTNYHIDFVSAIEHKNVTAMQFHPEKSGEAGLVSIKKWLGS